MRRLLGLLLLTTLLLGLVTSCGGSDATDTTAADPSTATTTAAPAPSSAPAGATAPAATDSPTTPPGDPVDFTEVAIVSQTAAGTGSGEPTGTAQVLDGQQSIGPFVDQFQQGPLTSKLLDAIDAAEVPAGQVLAAGVVSVGCDVPPGVAAVTSAAGGLVITAQPVADPKPECFAPVTSVALVLVPADSV